MNIEQIRSFRSFYCDQRRRDTEIVSLLKAADALCNGNCTACNVPKFEEALVSAAEVVHLDEHVGAAAHRVKQTLATGQAWGFWDAEREGWVAMKGKLLPSADAQQNPEQSFALLFTERDFAQNILCGALTPESFHSRSDKNFWIVLHQRLLGRRVELRQANVNVLKEHEVAFALLDALPMP